MEKQDREQKKPIFWGKYYILIILAVVVLLAFFLFFWKLNTPNSFSTGVEIGDISLTGLTKDQLRQLLTQRTLMMKNQELSFEYDSKQYKSDFNDLEINYDIEKTIEVAWDIGRKGNFFANLKTKLSIFLTIKNYF